VLDPTAGTPVDFRAEVAEYDRLADVRKLDGARHRMTFRLLGEGPALVLLPGLASTYRGYALTLLRLADRFQTVQLDYPGEHTDDGANLGEIGHGHLVDDLFDLLDHLGLATACPFGLSFGSTITLEALRRDPGRFPRAALQGGFARRGLQAAERLALALGRNIRGTASRLPFHKLGLARNNRPTFPGDRPEVWDFYVEENGRTPIASLTHRLDLLDRLDLRPGLPAIGTETLVIHGTADRIVPMARHEELANGLPRGTVALMAGVGHQPHWTHPVELATLVGDFLGGGEGGAVGA
jgi:pimeloyl-ACP methyl ester carboxylesterase